MNHEAYLDKAEVFSCQSGYLETFEPQMKQLHGMTCSVW